MPKNPVTDPINDPITDQEIAFALLILSGTMNDCRAAEAVGLDPSTAAYTKSKPRVRDYIMEHRAASEKLTDQEGAERPPLNIGRDRILDRLWQLANLNPEQTRGSIAGQIKAMAMIVAIEGLIPNRRSSPIPAQPASPPIKAQIYVSEPMRRRQAEGMPPGEAVTAAETQPAAPPATEPPPPSPAPKPREEAPSPDLNRNQTSLEIPSTFPKGMNWVPEAVGSAYDADVHTGSPFRLPNLWKGSFRRGR